MSFLVADVGGTNTRIAVTQQARAGRPGPSVRLRNDDFADFTELLAAWRARQAPPPLAGACIAVAGPVSAGQARLTNRDWAFPPAEIAAALDLAPGRPVRLINDLAAQGHALAHLGGGQLADLRAAAPEAAPPPPRQGNGQALVVGLGTGFNICLVARGASGAIVAEAELGHASLPQRVAAALAKALGPDAARFDSNESLFSGRGLTRLYQLVSGGQSRAGEAVIAAYDPAWGGAETRSVDLMADLLGLLARELFYVYLPLGGIHFAGGAARGILGSPARARFLAAFDRPGAFGDQAARVPLRLITDDAAALTGAAVLAAADGGGPGGQGEGGGPDDAQGGFGAAPGLRRQRPSA